MTVFDFEKKHIENARKIAFSNYNEERGIVKGLPEISETPDLGRFAENGLGVVIKDGGDMLGFLCCYEPWENAFNSKARGSFSPLHAHGAVYENREAIYKKLYQSAAEKWVKDKITYHSVALYAHDTQAINAFFNYGFGLRCVDAVRPLTGLEHPACAGIVYEELPKAEVTKVREMRKLLSLHLGKSPCFMVSSAEGVQKWIERAETRDSRLFAAVKSGTPIAFIEVMDEGENFAAEASGMKNICGAFCYPEYRGTGIIQGLLNCVLSSLKEQGYDSLGVDFESFNPTASGFWLKYFTAYTNSVTRRIDECALGVSK